MFALCFFCFLMSLTGHEWAHAWMANRWGDPTARLMGRMTFNPLKHIDPMMTIVVPLVAMFIGLPLIGGAKPVPVNPVNFTDYKKAERMVSLAGIAVNLLIALVLSIVIRIVLANNPDVAKESPLFCVLAMTLLANLFLLIFNLLPIPPLDGSGFVATFLPEETARKYRAIGSFGIFIIIILLYLGVLGPILWISVDFIGTYFLRLDAKTWNAIGDAMRMLRQSLGVFR